MGYFVNNIFFIYIFLDTLRILLNTSKILLGFFWYTVGNEILLVYLFLLNNFWIHLEYFLDTFGYFLVLFFIFWYFLVLFLLFDTFLVRLDTFMVLFVILYILWYFLVIKRTLGYFWVLLGNIENFIVILVTF